MRKFVKRLNNVFPIWPFILVAMLFGAAGKYACDQGLGQGPDTPSYWQHK